jgi:hypothetical protein
MATDRPPPYFPQGSLSPPSESRYLKFKLIMGGAALILLLLIAAVVGGIWYLVKGF